ncbi:MAG TPA: transposase [Nostoc sp.]|uniref:transposase n=1 Tax=Nostoc sp. TaxID=1180 RepID=UPI002D25CE6C|nr:transposase [Nostoc sp.]HYX18670.1 transposase [Nostoc sp.]
MLFFKAHKEVVDYVDLVNCQLLESGARGMSRIQRDWLSYCITGVIVTGSICWAKIDRASFSSRSARALSFIFCCAKIPWDMLFRVSMLALIRLYNIQSGTLVIDDTERKRSKQTKTIHGVHKMKDKKTNGYIMGQELVIAVLVNKTISMPVGFSFYIPDPTLQAWQDQDRCLREQGVDKSNRPVKPKRDKNFPTKQKLGLILIRRFRFWTKSKIKIDSILADAAYMSKYWLNTCRKVFPQAQVISQIKSNQIVQSGNRPEVSAKDFFANARSKTLMVPIRGGKPKNVTMASARLFVRSLGRRMLIVALKYEGEDQYRYLAATDLTWRSMDIVKQYSLRWLIEVFNQDWKAYCGWGRHACQQGVDGARRGVCLSVLVDHCLLSHPEQLRLGHAAQPLWTVGSLHRKLQIQSLFASIETILDSDNPKKKLQTLAENLDELIELRPSGKHMAGREIGPPEPSPALQRKYKNTG